MGAFKGSSAIVQDGMAQYSIAQYGKGVVQYVLLSKHNTVKTQPQIICHDMT